MTRFVIARPARARALGDAVANSADVDSVSAVSSAARRASCTVAKLEMSRGEVAITSRDVGREFPG